MNGLWETLWSLSEPGQLLRDEPMSRHTTFRIGGPADMMFFPAMEQQLQLAIKLAGDYHIPCTVIGNGSNLIVRDGGVIGLVVVLGERFSHISIEDGVLTAEAGATLSRVAAEAQRAGLSGLEFASGIPGTLGGGCAMNAGAYGGQLSDVLIDARVLLNGAIQTLSREELQMGYRTTLPLHEGGIVLSARFRLKSDDPEAIQARMRDLNARRRDKQPLNFPSAGSVFKRPEGHFAGALIEQAGLKGERVGDAQVSAKHAGFIVNVGNATASDVLALIQRVQDAVFAQSGVSLETEVRVIGEE